MEFTSADGYERWAPFYDQAPNPLLAREERYLLPALNNLHDRRILDLACGTGRWLEKLLSRGASSAAGFDVSPEMLRVAAGKSGLKYRLARATCESLPFRTGAFELAICSFALGHLADFHGMARELARVTRAGADVFISDLHPDAYVRGWRVGFRDEQTSIQIKVLPRGEKEIADAFSACGFECVSCESLFLGNPEKSLFVLAGKAGYFEEACRFPAVLVSHFSRINSPDTGRNAQELAGVRS